MFFLIMNTFNGETHVTPFLREHFKTLSLLLKETRSLILFTNSPKKAIFLILSGGGVASSSGIARSPGDHPDKEAFIRIGKSNGSKPTSRRDKKEKLLKPNGLR